MPLALLFIIILLGLGVCHHLTSRYTTAMNLGRRFPSPENRTGAQIAEEFLRAEGAADVKVLGHEGVVSDYFDPARRCLYLRRDTREGKDLAAWAMALHEAAHALQTGEAREALKWRQTCISLCRYLPTALFILLLAAVFLLRLRAFKLFLILFAIACGGALLLNLGTLAVEYNANQRLQRWLRQRFARDPQTLEKLEAILASVATREAGDLLQSPRYFFLSALPGASPKRPS